MNHARSVAFCAVSFAVLLLPSASIAQTNTPPIITDDFGTIIRYKLPEAVDVQLRIYNLRGQEVRTLVSGVQPPGEHAAAWDGRNKQGVQVASGIYLYRLATKQFVKSRKMLLLR